MISLFNNNFIKKLNNDWIFEYMIVMIYLIAGALGWVYSFSIIGMVSVILSILLLFIFNDFKYIIPAGLMLIFSYNGGYESGSIPSEVVMYAGLLIGIIVLYSIFNFKLGNLRKPKSFIGIVLLAISCIIPIFWNKVITEETKLLYFVYFGWVLYVVIYFIFGISLGKNSLRMTIFTLSSLSLLLSFECLYKVMEIMKNNPNENLLSLMYYLGWGLCNEAGIMICFALPFVFYEIIKSNNPIISALAITKAFIAMVGILLTTSRGAFLFGAIEFVTLTILMVIFSKKKITNIVFYLLFVLLGCLFIHLNYGFDKLFEDIKNYIFHNGMSDNGRKELWDRAIKCWSESPKNKIFGSGIVSEIEKRFSFNGDDNVYIVYHSTFFETLAMGGIVGVCALCFHFFEKYKQLWKKEIPFVLVMLVGYLIVDAYGMIDNTYGMYYYMIPLVILMAALDNDRNTDIFNSTYVFESNS